MMPDFRSKIMQELDEIDDGHNVENRLESLIRVVMYGCRKQMHMFMLPVSTMKLPSGNHS
jgi:hypothetical protein